MCQARFKSHCSKGVQYTVQRWGTRTTTRTVFTVQYHRARATFLRDLKPGVEDVSSSYFCASSQLDCRIRSRILECIISCRWPWLRSGRSGRSLCFRTPLLPPSSEHFYSSESIASRVRAFYFRQDHGVCTSQVPADAHRPR